MVNNNNSSIPFFNQQQPNNGQAGYFQNIPVVNVNPPFNNTLLQNQNFVFQTANVFNQAIPPVTAVAPNANGVQEITLKRKYEPEFKIEEASRKVFNGNLNSSIFDTVFNDILSGALSLEEYLQSEIKHKVIGGCSLEACIFLKSLNILFDPQENAQVIMEVRQLMLNTGQSYLPFYKLCWWMSEPQATKQNALEALEAASHGNIGLATFLLATFQSDMKKIDYYVIARQQGYYGVSQHFRTAIFKIMAEDKENTLNHLEKFIFILQKSFKPPLYFNDLKEIFDSYKRNEPEGITDLALIFTNIQARSLRICRLRNYPGFNAVFPKNPSLAHALFLKASGMGHSVTAEYLKEIPFENLEDILIEGDFEKALNLYKDKFKTNAHKNSEIIDFLNLYEKSKYDDFSKTYMCFFLLGFESRKQLFPHASNESIIYKIPIDSTRAFGYLDTVSEENKAEMKFVFANGHFSSFNNTDKAIELFSEAASCGSIKALASLGSIFLMEGKFEEALVHYTKAVELGDIEIQNSFDFDFLIFINNLFQKDMIQYSFYAGLLFLGLSDPESDTNKMQMILNRVRKNPQRGIQLLESCLTMITSLENELQNTYKPQLLQSYRILAKAYESIPNSQSQQLNRLRKAGELGCQDSQCTLAIIDYKEVSDEIDRLKALEEKEKSANNVKRNYVQRVDYDKKEEIRDKTFSSLDTLINLAEQGHKRAIDTLENIHRKIYDHTDLRIRYSSNDDIFGLYRSYWGYMVDIEQINQKYSFKIRDVLLKNTTNERQRNYILNGIAKNNLGYIFNLEEMNKASAKQPIDVLNNFNNVENVVFLKKYDANVANKMKITDVLIFENMNNLYLQTKTTPRYRLTIDQDMAVEGELQIHEEYFKKIKSIISNNESYESELNVFKSLFNTKLYSGSYSTQLRDLHEFLEITGDLYNPQRQYEWHDTFPKNEAIFKKYSYTCEKLSKLINTLSGYCQYFLEPGFMISMVKNEKIFKELFEITELPPEYESIENLKNTFNNSFFESLFCDQKNISRLNRVLKNLSKFEPNQVKMIIEGYRLIFRVSTGASTIFKFIGQDKKTIDFTLSIVSDVSRINIESVRKAVYFVTQRPTEESCLIMNEYKELNSANLEAPYLDQLEQLLASSPRDNTRLEWAINKLDEMEQVLEVDKLEMHKKAVSGIIQALEDTIPYRNQRFIEAHPALQKPK